MSNRLLVVTLPAETIAQVMNDADDLSGNAISLDVAAQTLSSRAVRAHFELLPRHRRMFREGLDCIGLSLTYRGQIEAFAKQHGAVQPWLKEVARAVRDRLGPT